MKINLYLKTGCWKSKIPTLENKKMVPSVGVAKYA
jgi:hypothetical protein